MKHAELIARLEAAEVGDLDLSADVIEATGTPVPRNVPITWLEDHECAPVTTSLDAALALAKRVLPEAGGVMSFGGQCSSVQMHVPDLPRGRAKTPALALCIAILKALEAKQ